MEEIMKFYDKPASQYYAEQEAKGGTLRFTVFCTATPQGSKKAFVIHPKGGGKPRAVVVEDNKKTMPYRHALTQVVLLAMRKAGVTERPWAAEHVPVHIEIRYYLAKPPSAKKRMFPVVKPDLDKLDRATGDALTGVVYSDDAQVVSKICSKHYGSPERVEIVVRIMANELIGLPHEVKAVTTCG